MTTPPFPPGPPPPPSGRRRTWLIVLISVGVLLVTCCGLGLGRLVFRLKQVSDIDKDVNKAAAAFVEDTRDGLSRAGYDGLCAEARDEFRPQDLTAPPKDAFLDFRIVDTTVDHARRQARVTVELKRVDGSTDQQLYVLDEEAERWRMCAFPR